MPRELREHDEEPRTPRLDELTENSSYEEITASLEHELATNPPTRDELTNIETQIVEIDTNEPILENEPSTTYSTEPIETNLPTELQQALIHRVEINYQETNDHQISSDTEEPLDEQKRTCPIHQHPEPLETNDYTVLEIKKPLEEQLIRTEPSSTTFERPYHSFREWYENPNWDDIPINSDSKAALDAMIERHPYFKDRNNFSEQYRQTQWYIVLKDSQANADLPNDSQRGIAHRIGISDGTISLWLRDIKQPGLINRLLIHEKARCYHEAKHHREHSHYRVDPSTIYDAIRPLRHQAHTPENLSNAIEHIYKSITPTRVHVIEFKTYHESGPRWTRNVGKAIETHRIQLEHLLNQRINRSITILKELNHMSFSFVLVPIE